MSTRPDRVPADEIRQRMLDAGRELALEAGAALTIEHLRLEEVIQRARVPRSSAYRLWPYKDDYIDDLLCYLAGAGSWFSDRPVMTPDTTSVVRRLISDNSALLATMEGRRALLCEIVRITTESNYQMLSDSPQWRLHMALVATLGSTSDTDPGGADADGGGTGGAARQRVAAALEEAQLTSREVMVAVFGVVMAELGLRLRDPAWTAEHLQLAGGLFVQGLALRNVQVMTALGERGDAPPGGTAGPLAHLSTAAHVDSLLNAPVPGPGLHGGTAEWTLVAFAYLGLIDAFTELDPDFVPPRLRSRQATARITANNPSPASRYRFPARSCRPCQWYSG
jgi:AcrR family transcriptional regulator